MPRTVVYLNSESYEYLRARAKMNYRGICRETQIILQEAISRMRRMENNQADSKEAEVENGAQKNQ